MHLLLTLKGQKYQSFDLPQEGVIVDRFLNSNKDNVSYMSCLVLEKINFLNHLFLFNFLLGSSIHILDNIIFLWAFDFIPTRPFREQRA
jgi:hypothetical protein